MNSNLFARILAARLLMAFAILRACACGEIDLSFNISQSESPTAVTESRDGTVWVSFELAGVHRYGRDGQFQNRTLKPARGNRLIMLTNETILVGGPRDPYLTLVSTGGVINAQVNANGRVGDMVQQDNGKILLTGNFTIVNGAARPYIARLNADCSLDDTFQPPLLIGQSIQPQRVIEHLNESVVVAGEFGFVGDTPRDGIARFDRLGALDETFDPASGLLRPLNPWRTFKGLLALPDGSLLIASIFHKIGGGDSDQLVRLNNKGEITDYWFDFPLLLSYIADVAVLDGKPLVALTTVPPNQGIPADARIVRLLPSGALDPSFSFPKTPGNPFYRYLFVTQQGRLYAAGQRSDTYANVLFRLKSSPAVPEIRLTGLARDPHGIDSQTTITISSSLAAMIRLESSLTLNAWSPVVTNSVPKGTSTLSLVSSLSQAFYRAHLLP